MKLIIHVLVLLCGLSLLNGQTTYYKTIDLGALATPYQLVTYKGRIFVSTAMVCDQTIECATIMEIDDQANVLWSKNLPFLDVSSKTMLIHDDTITMTGNNIWNDKFILHQMHVDDGRPLATYDIQHPTMQLERMFVQSILRYHGNFIVAGAYKTIDSQSVILFVVNPKGKVISSKKDFTSTYISLLWDAYVGSDGFYTAFYYIDEYAIYTNYRKVVKFDKDFNAVWSYTSDSLSINDSLIKGCELPDGRIAFVCGHPKGRRSIYSVRCVNLDSTISWQHDWASMGSWVRKISRLKVLSNGDILGCGEYGSIKDSFRVDGSAFMFRLSAEGKLLWEHAYAEVAPDGEDKGGNLWDFLELSDGSILAAGFVKNKHWDVLFIRTDANGCIISDNCPEVIVINTTAETDYIDKVSIYPNPTTDVITIEATEPLIYEIISITSQTIRTTNDYSDQHFIDLSALSPGIYFLKTKTKVGKYGVRKIVKQ